MKHALLMTATALSLTACATAPYTRSGDAAINRPAASGAFIGASNPAVDTSPVAGNWWRLYNDDTLNGLVTDALKANTDLRVAAANIARSDASLDAIRDTAKVQTNIEAAAAYEKLSAEQYLMIGGDIPSLYGYDLDAGISYKLDFAGQIKLATQAARADVGATRAAYDMVRITVVAGTTQAWLDTCAAGQQIAIAKRALDLQKENTELTRRMIAAGRSSSMELTRSSGQEAQIQAQLPALLAARQSALYRIATLTGRTSAELPAAIGSCETLPHLDQPIPVGDGAALLARRPDVRKSELELAAATDRIGVAHADMYPHISLGASIGSLGATERFMNQDTFKYSIGPLISWEFPNRGRVEAHTAAAKADSEAAQAKFDGAVLNALRETETTLSTYGHDLDQRRALEHVHADAEKQLADARTLFKAGRTNITPVMDARRIQITADQLLAASDARLAADQVQLFLALGGGWEDAKPN